jgi:ParB-like chromosome segregation protein Spo0J
MNGLKVMKVHPVAKMFPTLPAKEMKELRADIETNGIRVPIIVNKAKDTILDGRNRYMIASELKLGNGKVPFEVFEGTEEDIPGMIVSRNILRRHLSDDQRIMLTAKILGPKLEKEAAKAFADKKGGKGKTAERLAKEVGSTKHKAEQAISVSKHAKDLVDEVVAGKVALKKAAKVAKSRKPSKRKPKEPKTLEQIVAAKFQRFMAAFPMPQHREVKKILRSML